MLGFLCHAGRYWNNRQKSQSGCRRNSTLVSILNFNNCSVVMGGNSLGNMRAKKKNHPKTSYLPLTLKEVQNNYIWVNLVKGTWEFFRLSQSFCKCGIIPKWKIIIKEERLMPGSRWHFNQNLWRYQASVFLYLPGHSSVELKLRTTEINMPVRKRECEYTVKEARGQG